MNNEKLAAAEKAHHAARQARRRTLPAPTPISVDLALCHFHNHYYRKECTSCLHEEELLQQQWAAQAADEADQEGHNNDY